jgi:hypothetical protein
VGSLGFLVLDSALRPIAGVELPNKVFTSRANMFYLLKHLLILILVIFKLKCNNLIFNEILILNVSYVCLLHSRFIENHLVWILEDGPLISKVVLSHFIWSNRSSIWGKGYLSLMVTSFKERNPHTSFESHLSFPWTGKGSPRGWTRADKTFGLQLSYLLLQFY